jgi:hypothetical protein
MVGYLPFPLRAGLSSPQLADRILLAKLYYAAHCHVYRLCIHCKNYTIIQAVRYVIYCYCFHVRPANQTFAIKQLKAPAVEGECTSPVKDKS